MTTPSSSTEMSLAEVTEIRVESLLGHRLRDVDGRSLGRIEEIVVVVDGTDWVVTEVHLGPGAMLERLVDLTSLVPFVARHESRLRKRYRVPWNRLDFTDPSRPRSTVRRGELERIAS